MVWPPHHHSLELLGRILEDVDLRDCIDIWTIAATLFFAGMSRIVPLDLGSQDRRIAEVSTFEIGDRAPTKKDCEANELRGARDPSTSAQARYMPSAC